MEQRPSWRIVGSVDNETEEELKKEFSNSLEEDDLLVFSKEDQELIRTNEVPKTEMQERAIEIANEESNKLMVGMGISPYIIPSKNIHILPHDIYIKITGTAKNEIGISYPMDQNIFFDEEGIGSSYPLKFWTNIFHEILHLKAHISVHAVIEKETGDIHISEYRSGVSINSPQFKDKKKDSYRYFLGLHEAIITDIEKKYTATLLDLPELQEQKDWLASEEAKSIKKDLAHKHHISEDEIIWVSKDKDINAQYVSYPYFRDVFYYVVQEIQEQFKDQFPNGEFIKKEFIKSYFTGQLLPIARLMTDTFGKQGFRILGSMKDEESAIHVKKLLQRTRMEIEKNS